jgi:hypothetical protein
MNITDNHDNHLLLIVHQEHGIWELETLAYFR